AGGALEGDASSRFIQHEPHAFLGRSPKPEAHGAVGKDGCAKRHLVREAAHGGVCERDSKKMRATTDRPSTIRARPGSTSADFASSTAAVSSRPLHAPSSGSAGM